MDHRYPAAVSAALASHPFSGSLTAEAITTEFDLHNSLREWDVASLSDDVFASQAAQAVDRAAIREGLTTERYAPVAFHGEPNFGIKTNAAALKVKASMRQSGLSDAEHFLRVAAAVVEVMSLSRARFPALATDKGQQKVSGIVFAEVMQTVESKRPDLRAMNDGEILALVWRCFEDRSAKINRELKA